MIFSPFTPFLLNIVLFFLNLIRPFLKLHLGSYIKAQPFWLCKAYGCEPSIDLFRGFFNLCRAEQNKLDSKSFKDKLPLNIKENPMFQRLSRYPTSVRVFPDPILFLASLKPSWEYEMAFRNFIYTEDHEDLLFFPKEPSLGFGIDSRENPKPELFVFHPRSLAARIKDKKCKTRGGSSRPLVKRKLAPGSLTSHATRAKTSSSKDDAPFLTVSDDDEGLPTVFELNDATACHLKISAITPPA
ncbi:hypothetical protein Tco_0667367 [Tanacetum coccineum]